MTNRRNSNGEMERPLKVTDRRKFTSEGEIRGDVDAQMESGEHSTPKVDEPERAPAVASESQPPKMDFSAFLLSLATTGMVHLGEIPEPTTNQKVENLEAARQMIDILILLQEKTRNNLESEEKKLLEGLLYELRMKFLEKSKPIKL